MLWTSLHCATCLCIPLVSLSCYTLRTHSNIQVLARLMLKVSCERWLVYYWKASLPCLQRSGCESAFAFIYHSCFLLNPANTRLVVSSHASFELGLSLSQFVIDASRFVLLSCSFLRCSWITDVISSSQLHQRSLWSRQHFVSRSFCCVFFSALLLPWPHHNGSLQYNRIRPIILLHVVFH